MQVEIENYKGIEFIRISSLPDDQKNVFWQSFDTQKIIKILRDNELLNDCLRYGDYQDWYQQRLVAESRDRNSGELAHLVFK